MLSVTTTAKDKLREELLEVREDDTSLIRIAPSTANPAKIGFLLDTEKDGDKLVMDNMGDKLLLVDSGLADILSGMVLDFGETVNGPGYTITKE